MENLTKWDIDMKSIEELKEILKGKPDTEMMKDNDLTATEWKEQAKEALEHLTFLESGKSKQIRKKFNFRCRCGETIIIKTEVNINSDGYGDFVGSARGKCPKCGHINVINDFLVQMQIKRSKDENQINHRTNSREQKENKERSC